VELPGPHQAQVQDHPPPRRDRGRRALDALDHLELWRVLDVRYERNLIDQIFDNAKIILIGTDQTTRPQCSTAMPTTASCSSACATPSSSRAQQPPDGLAPGHHGGHEVDALTGGAEHQPLAPRVRTSHGDHRERRGLR
jgi:hypothetical protein